MRSLIPFGGEVDIRPIKMHDIIAYYRDSKQLEKQLEGYRESSGSDSYDYGTYDDVKPESLDNPPIQHIDRLAANKASREPIVHRYSKEQIDAIASPETLETAKELISETAPASTPEITSVSE